MWNDSLTLQEHLRLRAQYNAKLLWSGDWSTFNASNYWVTIVPLTFRSSDGALQWCTKPRLRSKPLLRQARQHNPRDFREAPHLTDTGPQ